MNIRDRIANGLTEDLQVARASARVMFHLREMVTAHSPLAINAKDFIWIAMRATRDTCVIHLWKALDTQPSARSIPWFIRQHSAATESQQATDLRRLSAESGDVKRLAMLRHQVFAHRGKVSDETQAEDIVGTNNISETEFLGLVAESQAILARHLGRPLFKQIDIDDYEAVGELVDLDVYLQDTERGIGGIEPIMIELDGQPRAPMVPLASVRRSRT